MWTSLDTFTGIVDTSGMKLALAIVMMSSTVYAAPCMRPKLLPAGLPLMNCPVREVEGRCTAGCPKNGHYADLYYRDDPQALAIGWRETLDSDGWDTRATKITLEPNLRGEPNRHGFGVTATKGHDRVSTVVIAASHGETLLTLMFTPG